MQGVALEIRETFEIIERCLNGSLADFKDEVLTKIDEEGKEIKTGVYSQLAYQQKKTREKDSTLAFEFNPLSTINFF